MSKKKYEKVVFAINTVLIVLALGLKKIFVDSLVLCVLPEIIALCLGICVVGIGSKMRKEKTWWLTGLQTEWCVALVFLLFSKWFDVKYGQWFLVGVIPVIVSICFILINRSHFVYLSTEINTDKVKRVIRLLAYPVSLVFVLARKVPDMLDADKVLLSDILGIIISSVFVAFLLYFFVLSLLRKEEPH